MTDDTVAACRAALPESGPRLLCLFCGRIVAIECAPEHTCRPAHALGPLLASTWRPSV